MIPHSRQTAKRVKRSNARWLLFSSCANSTMGILLLAVCIFFILMPGEAMGGDIFGLGWIFLTAIGCFVHGWHYNKMRQRYTTTPAPEEG